MTFIHIQEVIARDGFQIEKHFVPTDEKIKLLNALSDCGYSKIEVTSFVSPKAVPNLRDAKEVVTSIKRHTNITYVALVPNLRGAQDAIAAGIDEINVVMSASETHNQKNVKQTKEASLQQFRNILQETKQTNILVNGSIATSFGCPFEGKIAEVEVLTLVEKYLHMGMDSITLADTTGMANPKQVEQLVTRVFKQFGELSLTLHFHNTRGMGLANVIGAIQGGATRFDASLGGIGGCPFAPGATGNICTEDTVHMLEEMGLQTNIDLDRLMELAKGLPALLQREDIPGQIIKAGKVSDLHES